MKKKLITLILCGVIGGASIAGAAIYLRSEGTNETPTLMITPDKEDENHNSSEVVENPLKDSEVEDDNLNKNDGQASENLQTDSKANDSAGAANKNPVKNGQDSWNGTGESKNDSVSNEGKEDATDSGSNNNYNNDTNGGNTNEGNSSGSITPPVQDTGSFHDQVEQFIFNRVNEERVNAGVPPLSYNSTMETYARLKSKDMGVRNYFDHVNPEGEMITAQMARDGIAYSAWGENIAYIGGITDQAALAEQFMTNWMNSPGHKENILSTNFTSIGVGVYKAGNRYYATQEFYR